MVLASGVGDQKWYVWERLRSPSEPRSGSSLMTLRRVFALLLCAIAAGSAVSQEQPTADGPARMRDILARGVAPAPVDSGLGFALTSTGGGAHFVAGPWMLRIPGAAKPLELSF